LVGFRAEADFASGPAANDLYRLPHLRHWLTKSAVMHNRRRP
jgi:hypothetical protein